MNVLIYSGEGTSVDSVRQTKSFLTGILSPYYAVSVITEKQILEEPWMGVTSLLVIPGGADLPYCKALNGAGNQRIKQYIKKGGKFLGICAGGYYAAKSIEFEKGTKLEVSGPRELALYDGAARGTVFKGFVYGSDEGAHASKLYYMKNNEESSTVCYFNGGCMFEGDNGAEVLARYAGPVQIEDTERNPAAIVFKTFGHGKVMLSGVHFEYDLDDKAIHQRNIDPEVVKRVYESRQSRLQMVQHLFADKLGLKVSTDGSRAPPRISPLHLTSLRDHTPSVAQFLDNVSSILDQQGILTDNEDTFKLVKKAESSMETTSFMNDDDKKLVIVHDTGYPAPQETPYFNHGIYYAELASYIESRGMLHRPNLGSLLLYGEVVSSTSTMLERNPQLLRRAPHGLVAFGNQQIAGRGRGSNVWVNPIGVMAVSGVIRIAQSQCHHSLVFIQYISSLAIIRAIKSFLPSGVDIGLRLKWPNDVYIRLDDSDEPDSLAKVSGVIVSCNAVNGDFVVVFGSGTNVDNPNPSISVNSRIAELNAGPQIQLEKLLARFLTILDEMVQKFLVSGFSTFEQEYKSVWMHNDAQVTLERYGNVRAVVKGISSDTGMLIAEDNVGVKYELQPDGNSFDMLRGLIRRKAD